MFQIQESDLKMRARTFTRLALLPLAVLQAGLLLGSPAARADQVILDDQIVDGSQCVGFDCVNGETFGFDTLRLKENNLRIRFQDTSSSASFPTNDWMIVINDSANGGSERFSIEDVTGAVTPFTILAGAKDDALHVSDRGLGLGTNLPDRPIHVVVGNTPALRLEQSSAGGWPAQVWDLAGNESFFFVRDGNNNTTPLRILPGSDNATLVIGPGGGVTVSGMLTQGSSRAIKHAFESVGPESVLDTLSSLPVSRWQYRSDETGAQHIGPMAEEFHRAFGLGSDDKHIAPADLAGVAVVSVQALRQRVVKQAAEIERLRSHGDDMAERLTRLEALLAEDPAN
jgi:hypothetical protein